MASTSYHEIRNSLRQLNLDDSRPWLVGFSGADIAWESEVWIAEDPEHMIHVNGERFLGPYPDVMPKNI